MENEIKDMAVISEDGDTITVGFGFSHFNKECEEIIYHEGSPYSWGPLAFIPDRFSGSFCSCREYTKKK